MKILVLNAGSSNLKCSLFDVADRGDLPLEAPPALWQGEIEGARLRVQTRAGATLETDLEADSMGESLTPLLQSLWSGQTAVVAAPDEIALVGHRVVQGGRYRGPTRVTDEVKAEIARLIPLAPSHNPAALAGIEAVGQLLGAVPQIAVFDTAFGADLPDAAAIYPIPYEQAQRGLRRTGFHGISHADCAARATAMLGGDVSELRLISCHLGNGCSLSAVENGICVDTTMGFTPLEGLMMGTRSGSVDPGLTLHLLRGGLTTDELERMLTRESGLKGVSGVSGDMREVMAARSEGNVRAALAFDIYLHRLRAGIGAMLASLGGLDALIFTGGVGQNSATVRAAACEKFGFLGLSVAPDKNEGVSINCDISSADSAVRVLVLRAQENWAIARACQSIA